MSNVTHENLLGCIAVDLTRCSSWGVEFTGCDISYNRLLKFIYHSSVCLDKENVNDVLKSVNETSDDTLWFKVLIYTQCIILMNDVDMKDTLTVVDLDDAFLPESMTIKKERPFFMWLFTLIAIILIWLTIIIPSEMNFIATIMSPILIITYYTLARKYPHSYIVKKLTFKGTYDDQFLSSMETLRKSHERVDTICYLYGETNNYHGDDFFINRRKYLISE